MKLVAGPARLTKSMSRRGLRSRAGFTGTGLAQPSTGRPASAPMAGRMIEPNGSMCGIGLSVSRPARLAVSSPNQSATTPWLISCRMTGDDQAAEEDDGAVVRSRRHGGAGSAALRRAVDAEPGRRHRLEAGLGDRLRRTYSHSP